MITVDLQFCILDFRPFNIHIVSFLVYYSLIATLENECLSPPLFFVSCHLLGKS